MTIKTIKKDLRCIDFGVVDKNVYSNLKDSYRGFGKGHFLYYSGFDKNKLKGVIPSYDYDSTGGYAPGKEYFLELWPSKMIHIYNEERSVDLKGALKEQNEPYYLFVNLLVFPSSCSIERLF